MALSSKEKATESDNANGVVISVYTESKKTRSAKLSTTKAHTHFNHTKEIASDSGTNGYDRRALLLDYSRNLRNSASQNVPMESQPKIKSSQKGVRLNKPVRIRSCSSSMEMLSSSTIRCRKEQEESKESKEGNRSKKRRSRWKNPAFLEKVKNIYTQLSCKDI